MSGQDEKAFIIDRAERKYEALMKILQKGGNPDLPNQLVKAIANYKQIAAISNSMAFEDALRQCWEQVRISSKLRPKLERIAKEEGPSMFEGNYLGYWERWEKLVE